MTYVGRGVDTISNVEKLDNITFDGSTTYNLTKSSVAFTPSGANNILISIDGVVQQGNFSVAGATIIFDFSPTSNNTCNFIMHYGTGVLNTPADDTVSAGKLQSNSVTTAKILDANVTTAKIADVNVTTGKIADVNVTEGKIADNAITLAKMASGTDGNIISYDASGNPVAIATGTSGHFLKSQGAGNPPVFAAAGGGKINQVLQSVQLATQTFSGVGTTWTDCTNLTVNITPSASNSKVLIFCDVLTGSSKGGWNYKTRLMRDSTQIYVASSPGTRPSVFGHVDAQRDGTQYNMWKMSATFLDAPSSSSQLTYKIQLQQNGTNATSYVNRTHDDGAPDQSRGASSITVMEVLA